MELDVRWAGKVLVVSLRGGTMPVITISIRLRIRVPQPLSNYSVHAYYEGSSCAVSFHRIDQTTIYLEVSLSRVPTPDRADS